MTSGTWAISFRTPLGKNGFDLEAMVDGEKLTGKIHGSINQDVPISMGKVEGSNVSFQVPLKTPIGETGASFNLQYNGKELTGTMSTRFGTYKVTGIQK